MPVMHKCKLVWNFNNKSGWDEFQELTTNDQTFSNIWASSDDVEASYKTVVLQIGCSIIKKYDL